MPGLVSPAAAAPWRRFSASRESDYDNSQSRERTVEKAAEARHLLGERMRKVSAFWAGALRREDYEPLLG